MENDVTTSPEQNKALVLKAFDIPDDSTVEWFKTQLTGITLYVRYLRQGGGFAGRKPQT